MSSRARKGRTRSSTQIDRGGRAHGGVPIQFLSEFSFPVRPPNPPPSLNRNHSTNTQQTNTSAVGVPISAQPQINSNPTWLEFSRCQISL
jgi:hypothetical protein